MTTTVDLAIDEDGSGTVTVSVELDAGAAAELAPIGSAFATGDLAEAGWKVDPVTTDADGGARIAASKRFENPEELTEVIVEVSGPSGPLRDVRLVVENGFASSSMELTGRVSLTGSLEQFSDPEVASLLDGFALGRSPEEITRWFDEHPDAWNLALVVHMPREVWAPVPFVFDGSEASASWTLGNGPVEEDLLVRSEHNARLVVLWLLLAGVAVVAGLALIAAGSRRGRRPSPGGSAPSPPRAAERPPRVQPSNEPRHPGSDLPSPPPGPPRWADDPDDV